MSYTLIIIAITAIVSIMAFSNEELYNRLILWPRRMDSPGEYYRLLTSGFIHADWMHLLFNMYALFMFGRFVEDMYILMGLGSSFFLLLYLAGIVAASLPSYVKNRNNSYYRSLGASGGVSAIIFSSVYFSPWSTIYILIIPVPAILAAIGYVAYSAYMSRRGGDNVNHDAHLWGAVFGFVFTLLFSPDHGSIFIQNLMHPTFNPLP
jgi:membrane associated rhomboid family serine protease